ncbi:group II truncated hemoglobin [Solimonas soli]|uniref:group II truncated hemoglobin n=1 Tax=Solimonas soli TaxID=413479 RepID=UPI0004815988|nr:group II truncated hemoglobin [Solimonas soli]
MTTSLYERLGGDEAVLRRLVDAFYDRMDRDAVYAGIRALHPPSLDGSRDKLFWYLCGWTGGEPHYVSRFGHPRLRARHLPFAIATRERDQWLDCMAAALLEAGIAPALGEELMRALAPLADWMRNRAE